jgi:predicted MFS family arabinose efflux permease
MATATYLQGALSVVSSFVIDEFGLSRSQFGAAFTAFSLTGAFASPVMGALTDRSTNRVMVGLFGLSSLAVGMVAVAPNFALLIAGSILGGLALGAGNPVTNRVIADRIGTARRGLVVGLKQSGPPLGLLVAGVVLPPLALAIGWRGALAVSALIPILGLVATPFILSRPSSDKSTASTRISDESPETRSAVIWLTLIGLGVALALSAAIAFVPLYAQESLGASAGTAGALAAVMGLVGVAGRIFWGVTAGRFARPTTPLLIISLISLAATLAVALAQTTGMWVLWIGVIGVGVSMLAWHAVAWLVIIDRVGIGGVGKASGLIQLGNSLGFAAGPLIVGVLLDTTSSYAVAWSTVAGVLAISTALTVLIRIRTTTRSIATRSN